MPAGEVHWYRSLLATVDGTGGCMFAPVLFSPMHIVERSLGILAMGSFADSQLVKAAT
mgnify:CR=1 FL=1